MGKGFTGLLIIIILCFMTPVLLAQGGRDYEIESVTYELINDDSAFDVAVTVQNNGSDATEIAELVIRIEGNPEPLAIVEIAPLPELLNNTYHSLIPIENLPPGTQQTLEISAGVDDIEVAGTRAAEDNIMLITIDVPARATPPGFFARTPDGFILGGQEISMVQFSIGILASILIMMLFWFFTIFIRALFRRPPRFPTWQPPYGVMPMYDQNTVEGRRWGWQQVAQNGLLLAPTTPGNIHPVKLLMSAEGINLDNWKVTGMRLSQYDVYGRIARTQIIAEKKWVNRMNKVLKKRNSVDEAKLQKMIRPITGALVKQFTKKVTKKTAFLPIAFDMRWEGSHGDVRIIFELYQFSERAWYRIDQWDPMMQIVSRSMQENYTFTIHGKENAEKMREFRERLRDDLIWLLLESFRVEAVQEQITGQQAPVREQFDIPDTLAGMDPIQADDKPMPARGDV